MSTIEPDTRMAVVKIDNIWRYFYGMDFQFLLDWNKYFGDTWAPSPDESRYNARVVNKQNFDSWAKSLDGEITLENLKHYVARVRLSYFIDFDRQLWVGFQWAQDQSPLQDYQPDGWIAVEDDVRKYLPDKIAQILGFSINETRSIISSPIIATINNHHFVIVSPGGDTNNRQGVGYATLDILQTEFPSLTIIRLHDDRREIIYDELLPDLWHLDRQYVTLLFTYMITRDDHLTIVIEAKHINKDAQPVFVDRFTYHLQ